MKFIAKKIKQYKKIIIIMHIRPDGDAFGSAFALKYLIQANYPSKEVHVVGENDKKYKMLGSISNVSENQFAQSLVISVDTGSKSRIGDKRFHLGEYIIRIDHHVKVDSFGNYELIVENAPACAVIITDLALENKWKFTDEAAMCLFTGIVADTNRFLYRAVTSDTYKKAAFLTTFNFNPEEVHKILNKKSISAVKFLKTFANAIDTTPNGVIYAQITKETISKANITESDASEFVDYLSDVDKYPIWVLFYQVKSGYIRARIKSRTVAINKVAAKYSGGGHQLASGAIINSFAEVSNVVSDLDLLLTYDNVR